VTWYWSGSATNSPAGSGSVTNSTVGWGLQNSGYPTNLNDFPVTNEPTWTTNAGAAWNPPF
jgi:hypothetical protein